MVGILCPQCKKKSNDTANRLVKDSCGHEKCRMCLLLDEERCKQCQIEQSQSNVSINSVDFNKIDCNHESVIKFENHTGVIACNTAVKKNVNVEKKSDEKPSVQVKDSPNLGKMKVKSSQYVSGVQNKRSYQKMVIPPHITSSKNPSYFKCNICNKKFNTKSQIKYHIYCTGQIKPFQCNLCSKSFVTKSCLDVHMVKHSGIKPYKCTICQKSFTEKSKLNRHNIIHSSVKPFVCAECGKSFRSKESIKIHTLIHRGEKPYTCNVCSQRFNNTSNLNKHLLTHSSEKPHMCDQCGKTFKLKWALTVHHKSHLRLRSFICDICSRTFINNKDLQRHQLIHLESKAYNCNICMTSFRRKDNLHRHIKSTHPGKKIDSVATVKPSNKLVDNPNAINVITASPASKAGEETISKKISRTGTVINGPLKLAFKTNAFKNNYNIHRDCDYDSTLNVTKSYDLAESVNICQKILSNQSPSASKVVDEPTTTEICQKILSPYPSRPIHYETSFEHKKHAIIKNIKFKLPSYYTNLKCNDTLKNLIPLKPVNNLNVDTNILDNDNNYTELKTVPIAATSVIVNGNLSQNNSMHWRRRMSQNLCSKYLED